MLRDMSTALIAPGNGWMAPCSLIVGGNGTQGRTHKRCLEKLRGSDLAGHSIGLVDLQFGRRSPEAEAGVACFSYLGEVTGFPRDTVIHDCTPSHQRVHVVETAAKLGFKNFILEKPLATTAHGLAEIVRLTLDNDLRVAVASPWPATALANRIRMLIASGQIGEVHSITAVQNKPRVGRSAHDRAHASALEVELPHLAALALHVLPGPASLVWAECWHAPKHGDGRRLGGASMTLRQGRGTLTTLRSDLVSPVAERSITVRGDLATVRGFFPISGQDHCSQLQVFDGVDGIAREEYFDDEPLLEMLCDAYRWFGGANAATCCSLELNARAAELLLEASELCGLATPTRAPLRIDELLALRPPSGNHTLELENAS